MKEALVVFLLDVAENVQYSIQVRTRLLPLRYSIIHLFSALDIIEVPLYNLFLLRSFVFVLMMRQTSG
jgi:hypothetical protein